MRSNEISALKAVKRLTPHGRLYSLLQASRGPRAQRGLQGVWMGGWRRAASEREYVVEARARVSRAGVSTLALSLRSDHCICGWGLRLGEGALAATANGRRVHLGGDPAGCEPMPPTLAA